MATTVIGTGLLARAFSGAKFATDCVVIASGVSNSSERRQSEFEREARLVHRSILENIDQRILYFSTCSILQQVGTPYTHHKMEMEALVTKMAPVFHIFRLPQVVGLARNTTLVSHFVAGIIGERKIQLQRDAYRNLLGVTDVVRLVSHLASGSIGLNSIQHLAAAHSVSVVEILNSISELIGIAPHVELVEGGERYEIPIEFLRHNFDADDEVMKREYWLSVLKKYVPEICTNIMRSRTSCCINDVSAS